MHFMSVLWWSHNISLEIIKQKITKIRRQGMFNNYFQLELFLV